MPDHEPPCAPLEVLRRDFDEFYHEVLVGNKANPSHSVRLTLLEDAFERFSKNSSKLVWIGIGILATLAANLITGHLAMK